MFRRLKDVHNKYKVELVVVSSTVDGGNDNCFHGVKPQFNSVYLYSPFSQIINLLYNLFTDIPVPKPHIGSGKTPKQPVTVKK